MGKICSNCGKELSDKDVYKRQLPVYLHEAEYLRQYLSVLSYEELKSLWKCNDQIAQINYERVQTMNLRMQLTPALLSYEGIQYQYMAPAVLEDGQWEYVDVYKRQ